MPALPLIIDCDPGVDDAVMLMMALASDALDVRAITTVAGNVPLDLTSRNARMMCEIMDRPDVPVFAGCPRPILRPPVTAEHMHGESGISGLDPFEPKIPLQSAHAVTEIIRLLKQADTGEFRVVVTGPMTNLAMAFVMAPEITQGISEIVVMGGAHTEGGNVTPSAEYNLFADPHAAEIILGSEVPVTFLNLDVTHTVRADPHRLESVSKHDGSRARILHDLLTAANTLESNWNPGLNAPMHDPSTIAYVLKPDLFTGFKARVSIETRNGDTLGQTRPTRTQDGPHTWITDADTDGFFDLLETLVARS